MLTTLRNAWKIVDLRKKILFTLLILLTADLLAEVKKLAAKQHRVLYYGPLTKEELAALLVEHHAVVENPEPLEYRLPEAVKTAFNYAMPAVFGSLIAVIFNMFGGKIEMVTLRFPNFQFEMAMDRFGHDIIPMKDGPDHFTVTVPVAVGPHFYGWVFGLKNYVTIMGPEHVRQGMKDMLEVVGKRYRE